MVVTRTRQIGSRVALMIAGLLVALVAVELAMRATGYGERPSGLRGLHEARPDRAWLYGLRPNAHSVLEQPVRIEYRINTSGFRDREHSTAKAPSTYRILVLGDSLTFGYGVERESAFPAQLETLIARTFADADVEVLNFGIGGYNPYNEAELFADVGVTYRPDLVLVQFCINDLNDPTLHFDASTQLALPQLPEAAFPNPDARSAVSAPSRWRAWCKRSRLCERLSSRTRTELDASTWEQAFSTKDRDEDKIEWDWLRARYRQIADRAASIGAQMAVVAFPYSAQLDGSDAPRLQQRLIALGNDEGWPTIDLYPAFRAANSDDSSPFLDLWHPTPQGHQIAAKQILQTIACSPQLTTPFSCEE